LCRLCAPSGSFGVDFKLYRDVAHGQGHMESKSCNQVHGIDDRGLGARQRQSWIRYTATATMEKSFHFHSHYNHIAENVNAKTVGKLNYNVEFRQRISKSDRSAVRRLMSYPPIEHK
jgi:hypothetical protein